MSNKMGFSTPLKQIRRYCVSCSGESRKEVRNCPLTDCPLFPFRFGHNPKRKGVGGRKAIVCAEKR